MVLGVLALAALSDAEMGPIRPLPRSTHGLVARLAPKKSGLAVEAEIANTGSAVATLSSGPTGGWRLRVFSVVDGRLEKAPLTTAGHKMNMISREGWTNSTVVIRPGKTKVKDLRLRNYFAIKAPGRYIMQATTQWINITGRRYFVRLGTNLLGFTLNRAGKITWQTRNVTWPEPIPRKIPPTPQLHSWEIPRTGPVAALARLAAAIKRGDVQAAHSLVYAPSRESHTLAVVDDELALRRLLATLGQHFGAAAQGQFRAIPSTASIEATENVLRLLDMKTLTIEGNQAEVRCWEFSRVVWKWVPGWRVYFRRVRGQWKITGHPQQFPKNSPPRIWDRLLRAQTAIYNSLRHKVKTGKVRSFTNFEAELKTRLKAAAAENSKEMMAYMKGWMRKWRAGVVAQRKADLEAIKKAQQRDHMVEHNAPSTPGN